jgi:hypothetical protein
MKETKGVTPNITKNPKHDNAIKKTGIQAGGYQRNPNGKRELNHKQSDCYYRYR